MNECILVVDDDPEIVRAIAILLEKEGYQVLKAYNGMEALEQAVNPALRLIVIDVMMPRLDGLSAVMKIREKRNLPIIVLSAKSEDSDKVLGLSMGADDYIAKPFRARELLSRIRSVLRRTNAASSLLRLGDVEIDAGTACVRKAGRDLALTALEYRLLLLFAQSRGKLVTREHVRNAIWDSAGEYVSDNTLSVYVKRLRDKVEDDPAEPRLILTVRGLGYRTGA